MDKKTVKMSYEWWEATLEIELSEKTTASIKEQLLFWDGGQDRIDEEDGDIAAAYSKMLVPLLMEYSERYNVRGVQDAVAEQEGWAAIDGTCGVRLISLDSWEIEKDSIGIEEVADV